MGLSNHTLLMNIIIGLTNIKHWGTKFQDLKYTVVAIEPIIPLEDSKNSNPDIILYSPAYKHALILDCKSKTLKEEQTQKYINLRYNPNKLITYGHISNETEITGDISFISFHNLENYDLILSNSIPVLYAIKIEEGAIKEIQRKGDFNFNELNDIFPIPINSRIPYFIYPFDTDDTNEFKDYILQKLILYAYKDKQSFTIDELLEDIFEELWSGNIIHHKKKKEFKNKARDILKILREGALKNYLSNKKVSKSKAVWDIKVKDKSRSLQSFVEKCNDILIGTYTTLEEEFDKYK